MMKRSTILTVFQIQTTDREFNIGDLVLFKVGEDGISLFYAEVDEEDAPVEPTTLQMVQFGVSRFLVNIIIWIPQI